MTWQVAMYAMTIDMISPGKLPGDGKEEENG